jgi:hypothetical protein
MALYRRHVILLHGNTRIYIPTSQHPVAGLRERGINPYESFRLRYGHDILLRLSVDTPEFLSVRPINSSVDLAADFCLIAYPAHRKICSLGYPAGLYWDLDRITFPQRKHYGKKEAEFMYYMLVDGKAVPCDMLAWGELMAGADRHIKLTKLTDEYGQEITVSTVFLGLDHRMGGSGPPVLWETMVFGGLEDGWQDRYTDPDAAIASHISLVGELQTAISQRRQQINPLMNEPTRTNLLIPIELTPDVLERIALDDDEPIPPAILPPTRPILDDTEA